MKMLCAKIYDSCRLSPARRPRWSSVEEVTAHLGVGRDTMYRWIERKALPSIGQMLQACRAEFDGAAYDKRNEDAGGLIPED